MAKNIKKIKKNFLIFLKNFEKILEFFKIFKKIFKFFPARRWHPPLFLDFRPPPHEFSKNPKKFSRFSAKIQKHAKIAKNQRKSGRQTSRGITV